MVISKVLLTERDDLGVESSRDVAAWATLVDQTIEVIKAIRTEKKRFMGQNDKLLSYRVI